MRVAMLDMGNRKYGDATFCEIEGRTILIDGAHRGDELSSNRMTASVPDQLKTLTGKTAPYHFDLIVVTHCHSDHIGCIPELVANGTVTTKWALLADPRMGFGVPLDQTFPITAATSHERVATALNEEPLPDSASNDEVQALIDAAATLQERYAKVVEDLRDSGTEVIRYGRDPHYLLEREFESIGLKVLGPTVEQILICAHRIECERRRKIDAAAEVSDASDEVALYRALVRRDHTDDDFWEDGSVGSALNNQSIIMKIGRAEKAVLLTGDMQFASPGMGGLQQLMSILRQSIVNAGPYAFVRLSHHGAANGTDAALLDSLPETTCYGISTGAGDAGHPAKAVLGLLQIRSKRIEWARTDRNGRVTLDLCAETPAFDIERGRLSDAKGEVTRAAAPASAAPRRLSVKPKGWSSASSHERRSRLTGLPRLTFATNSVRLRARIGEAADEALDLVRADGHVVIDILNSMEPGDVAQQASGSSGVVLLGGYSVLPAFSVDTLPLRLRDELVGKRHADPDNYIVWSDDPYGDPTGRGIADLPVSRIPDGGDGVGLLRALSAISESESAAFGLRNFQRPFAEEIYGTIAGGSEMLQSQPTKTGQLSSEQINARHVYLLLHGRSDDATRFWGECDGGENGDGLIEALGLSDVPQRTNAIVFAGCCHSALITPTMAINWAEGPISDRTASDSLAIAFVHAGARAFIGTTGQHYSPNWPPYNTAAGPIHRAFWTHVTNGTSPAVALMRAKIDCMLGMSLDGDSMTAVDFKTWRQLTCLGLGW